MGIAMERRTCSRVLIVDDDETMCQAMEMSLCRADREITWRTSALDALELLADVDFDAIVSDLTMPSMSGIELCERVHARRPDVPVVVMSGRTSVDVARSALRVGAYDFVVKPVDAEVLSRAVDRAVEYGRLRREAGSRGRTAKGV